MKKLVYELYYNGEVIDSTDNKEDFNYIFRNYNIAFKGGVTYKKVYR